MNTALFVASASCLAFALSTSARAQSRVSIEVGGVISAYDLGARHGPATLQGALRAVHSGGVGGNSDVGSNGGVGSNGDSRRPYGIAVAEVRPTITLDSGFLMGVGFRAGQAGLGDGGGGLIGGDLSLGFAHPIGPLLPFIKGMFGFNNYSLPGEVAHRTDLRADAVLGTRLYVSDRLYVSAAAFAGWGDQYGGTLAIGADVVRILTQGELP